LSGLFVGLAVACGFLLGLRVGLALGHRNERRRLARARKSENG
jgi:hypothetical protein